MLQREYFYGNSNKGPIFLCCSYFERNRFPVCWCASLNYFSAVHQQPFVSISIRLCHWSERKGAIEITLRPILVNISTYPFSDLKNKSKAYNSPQYTLWIPVFDMYSSKQPRNFVALWKSSAGEICEVSRVFSEKAIFVICKVLPTLQPFIRMPVKCCLYSRLLSKKLFKARPKIFDSNRFENWFNLTRNYPSRPM